MKNVSSELEALLTEYMKGTKTTWYISDLYVFWLNKEQGSIYRLTDHDTNLTVGNNLYYKWPIEHDNIKEVRGMETSESTIRMFYSPTDVIPDTTITWYDAFTSGMFGNCYLSIDRLFSPVPWQEVSGNISSNYVLKGRFMGRLDVSTVTLTKAELTCKSFVELLNVKIPRNLIIPSCINAFCDSYCGLTKSNYLTTVTAQSGSSKSQIVTGLSLADGYFNYGSVIGMSGNNKGVTRSIKTYTSSIVTGKQ